MGRAAIFLPGFDYDETVTLRSSQGLPPSKPAMVHAMAAVEEEEEDRTCLTGAGGQ